MLAHLRSALFSSLLVASCVVTACTANLQSDDGETSDDGPSSPSRPTPRPRPTGGAPSVDGGGFGGAAGSPAGSGGGGPVSGEFLPCEASLFFLQHCDRCHGERGLELPRLTNWAEISAEAEYIREAVLGLGLNRMPPPPFRQLSEEALAPLLDWIADGTPYVTEQPTCF